ncbi:hypothetical protein TNCV_186351 [Trichonephila clavipes]|nr:hypothetical protein TNCV_186351 [Trichonephila clavipes]
MGNDLELARDKTFQDKFAMEKKCLFLGKTKQNSVQEVKKFIPPTIYGFALELFVNSEIRKVGDVSSGIVFVT